MSMPIRRTKRSRAATGRHTVNLTNTRPPSEETFRATSAPSIDRGAMIDVEHLDRAVVEIDEIDHPIGAPTRTQTASKRSSERLVHAQRVLSQRTRKEIQYGSRHCLR